MMFGYLYVSVSVSVLVSSFNLRPRRQSHHSVHTLFDCMYIQLYIHTGAGGKGTGVVACTPSPYKSIKYATLHHKNTDFFTLFRPPLSPSLPAPQQRLTKTKKGAVSCPPLSRYPKTRASDISLLPLGVFAIGFLFTFRYSGSWTFPDGDFCPRL